MEPQDDLPSVGCEGKAEELPVSPTNVNSNLENANTCGDSITKTCSAACDKEPEGENGGGQVVNDNDDNANNNDQGTTSMILGVPRDAPTRMSQSVRKVSSRENGAKATRRRSAESSEIRAIASTLKDNSASSDFQNYIATRISFANMLHEGKLPLTSFKEFTEGVGIQPRYLYYADNGGNCIAQTEYEYVVEWWIVVKFWMKIVVSFTVFGHVVLTVWLFMDHDPLRIPRLLVRCFVAVGALVALSLLTFLSVFQIRRLITAVIGFYLVFGVIMIDRVNLPVLLSEKYLNLVPCDYEECISAVSPTSCNQNALPFVVAQASVVVTLFRLPFTHVVTLATFITTFYVSMSIILKSSALGQVTTASWEMFPLLLTFWCLILSSRRGEFLSRFLFIHAKFKYTEDSSECNDGAPAIPPGDPTGSNTFPLSTQSTNSVEITKRCDASATSEASVSSFGTVDSPRSALSSRGVIGSTAPRRNTFQDRMKTRTSYWIGLFVNKFFGKKIFMSFENIIMRKSEAMCWHTIQFYNAEMEYCFLSARLRISMKYAMYSGALITIGYGVLTYMDLVSSQIIPEVYIFWRIALRGIFFAVCGVLSILNTWFIRDIYHRSLTVLLGTFVFLVVNLISDPPLLESLLGVDTCSNMNNIECAGRDCYSILAVLTAEFSWVLVQMRLKFHHTFACLISVCVLFLIMNLGVSTQKEVNLGELFCLLAAVCCFTIGAFRVDVTARALFIIEYERNGSPQQDGQEKWIPSFSGENVIEIAKRAKNTVTSVLSKNRLSASSGQGDS
eukprot:GEMP01008198.1.p1 GENE.GEMP01008198.1~~GEMP01008198.1.p1  ORF type:complete len:788 (+),score=91.06 GEMP01008198.1:39-2402(+)